LAYQTLPHILCIFAVEQKGLLQHLLRDLDAVHLSVMLRKVAPGAAELASFGHHGAHDDAVAILLAQRVATGYLAQSIDTSSSGMRLLSTAFLASFRQLLQVRFREILLFSSPLGHFEPLVVLRAQLELCCPSRLGAHVDVLLQLLGDLYERVARIVLLAPIGGGKLPKHTPAPLQDVGTTSLSSLH
jgi:hypothetical protein